MDQSQKVKYLAGGGIILVLACIAAYMLFFSGDRPNPAAADANAKAAEAIAEANAKDPAPPPPPPKARPTEVPEGVRPTR